MSAHYKGDAAAEIRSGRPDSYFDHIAHVYGDAFRSGTNDGAETFYLLYQQISKIGNEASTELFLSRFLPLLPKHARRRILNDLIPNARPGRRGRLT
jgi:hypothetical protein